MKSHVKLMVAVWIAGALFSAMPGLSWALDLAQIKEAGVIRHIGVPYANFITGSGDGMDVELVQLFARRIGVRYEYVKSSWGDVIGDLTGKKVKAKGDDIQILGEVPVKGDIIANGFTVLEWRRKIVDYSSPTFPTQVWVVAQAQSPVTPIIPAGDIHKDIAAVKGRLDGLSILGVADTCLDPGLYGIEKFGASARLFSSSLNELAPAVINGDAQATLLDVPDALIALEKWPGKIKVIGPVSPEQVMGAGFSKTAPMLRAEFDRFLVACRKNGTLQRLAAYYYPAVSDYYPEFFK